MDQNAKIPPNQLINRVGKYIYRHIDSAYKNVKTANNYDIYMTVYYQLPVGKRTEEDGTVSNNDVHEMKININLTTYSNKIRVNLTEISPNEWTFGTMVFPPEKLEDMQEARNIIYTKIIKELKKHYEEYDFLF